MLTKKQTPGFDGHSMLSRIYICGISTRSRIEKQISNQETQAVKKPHILWFYRATNPNFKTEDLESRFEHIIRTIGEAGFESVDDMATQNYTATLKEDSLLY